MKRPTDGQRSQAPGDDRRRYLRHWWEIPREVLWRFTSDLCAELTYRGAAARTGLSKEGLRKHVEGLTSPNRSTRQTLGEIFLATYPDGVMAKKEIGQWKLRPRLIELLPDGEEAAHEHLAKLFELARRFPDEIPGFADALQEWLDWQISGEYWHRYETAAILASDREWTEGAAEFREQIRRIRAAGKELKPPRRRGRRATPADESP